MLRISCQPFSSHKTHLIKINHLFTERHSETEAHPEHTFRSVFCCCGLHTMIIMDADCGETHHINWPLDLIRIRLGAPPLNVFGGIRLGRLGKNGNIQSVSAATMAFFRAIHFAAIIYFVRRDKRPF